jgi:hypothetical protein
VPQQGLGCRVPFEGDDSESCVGGAEQSGGVHLQYVMRTEHLNSGIGWLVIDRSPGLLFIFGAMLAPRNAMKLLHSHDFARHQTVPPAPSRDWPVRE